MRKLMYAMLVAALPVVASSLTSCSDDNELPDVKFNLSVDNAEIVNGTIYVVQGDSLDINSVTVTNQEAGKAAAITNVQYFIDGMYIGQAPLAPYAVYNLTDVNTPVGNYSLGIHCTVLAVDKSIAFGNVVYPIKVVSSADEIPSAPAATTATTNLSLKN